VLYLGIDPLRDLDDERKLRFWTRRAEGGFGVTVIDVRADPATARSYRVVSLVTLADIPDVVWADDETGCYGVQGRDAKGKRIVVERFGPIRIVTARR
jgi:hypothetical protein